MNENGKISDMMRVKLEASLETSIVQLVEKEYHSIGGNKVRAMFAKDIVDLVSTEYRSLESLEVGQVLWLGVDVNDRPSYGKSARNTRQIPVTLTLWNKDDLDMILQGYTPREIREPRITRLFREAYEQGALLTNADVGYLIGVSPSTVSKQAREFMERENVVLPTRGTIHDLGMATTHKRIIIRLYLQGYLTPEIAKITDHSEEAVDRYIRAFEKVRLLRHKDIVYIHRVTGMSKWLIRQYMDILVEFEIEVNNDEE